jgi:hypothetical protein
LCAITAGIDLDPAVTAKFNATSEKNGLSSRIRSAASAEPAVAVKALEWREYPNEYYPDVFGHCWDADTPFGRYEISEASASDSPYYNVCFGTSFVADKDGLPEAEAAAQADYEQRVRSALASPPPSPQAFVLEMNKCVEQANENATRAEENAARAERLEKELQMLRCKVSASPPPSPVVSEEMVRAGAEVIAASPLIDVPKLPADAWMGLSRAILTAALSGQTAAPVAKPCPICGNDYIFRDDALAT